MFNLFKRKSTVPFKAPSKKQIEECERLGLTIKPKMSSRDVWEMVEKAKKNPTIKAKHDAYIAEQNAEYEAEMREDYGNELIDELKKWEKICDQQQYLTVFKKGKTLSADIIEFDSADIEEATKPYVKIEALRPKIYKPKCDSPTVEWEKEISFRPKQILECIKLEKQIDIFDIEHYEQEMAKLKVLEDKHKTEAC